MEIIFAWIIKKVGETAFGKMVSDALEETFPNLFKSKTKEIRQRIDSSTSMIISRLESVDDIKREYRTRTEKSFQRCIDEAKSKLDIGKNERAKKEYEILLKDLNAETEEIDPHLFFRVYNNLGVCELNLGNLDKAAKLFEKAYSFETKNPTAIANYALSKFFKDQPEGGLKIINKLLEKNPSSDHAISVKANILHALKRYDELIPFLKEKNKTALAYWYGGFGSMDKKDYDAAISSFENLINLEPKNAKAYLLATQNVMVGSKELFKESPFPPDKIPPHIKEKFTKAISWLQKTIELLRNEEQKADLEMAYTNLSGCRIAIGLYDEAISAAEEAAAIDPKSAIPFLNKGIAQLKLGRCQDAIKSFQSYKNLGGGDIDVEKHIAFCALKTGDLPTAERLISALLENNSMLDLDMAELAIDLYSRKLDNEKLNPLLERIEKEFPNNSQALRIRGSYMQRLGLEGAKSLLQQAAENAASELEKILAEIDLADLLYNQKDYAGAAELYKKHVNIKEGNPATYSYAQCLYNSGQYGLLLDWIDSLDQNTRRQSLIEQMEAYANLYLNNLDKASQLFKDLFEKNPGSIQHLVYYGMCRFRLGKETEAKAAFDTIKNRVKETQDLIILAGGYESIGEWEMAIDLTFKALENDPHNPRAHLAFIFTFFRREQAEGKEHDEKYIKAFQKSIGEFNKRFPEEKALQGFEVKDNDISQILKVIDQAAEITDNATNLYKESQAPMAFVPRLTGKKPFDVWAAFTQMPNVGIKISLGAPDEIKNELSTIEEYRNRTIVTDIYPLFLLAHLDQLDLLSKFFKKIYVHQSVMDELTETIDDRKISARKGVSVLGKIDGQHRMIEIPPEQVQKTLDLLEKIRKFISSNSNIEVRGFSKEKPKEERNIINALDESTRDSVLLAQELEAPLYCDDRILRAVVNKDYGIRSFSSQTLFVIAHKNNLISLDKKFEFQKKMIDFHYEFISMDATFIFTQLKGVGYRVEDIQNIIFNLVRKETSIQSLGIVLADIFFILMMDKSINSQIKVRIFRYILKEAGSNHDLESVEEGIFAKLQHRVLPEKREQLKQMIRSFFQS